jgi:hypothetical protein
MFSKTVHLLVAAHSPPPYHNFVVVEMVLPAMASILRGWGCCQVIRLVVVVFCFV